MPHLTKSILYSLVAFGLLYQTCNTEQSFNLVTNSPNGRYTVQLTGTKKPPNALPGEFYVQQVTMKALRDNNVVSEDPEFYSEDRFEQPFLLAFPLRQWTDNSVLRLGDSSKQPFSDEISLSNNTEEPIDLLIVKYGKYERFLVFDLKPGARIQLQASPQLDKDWVASEVRYTAYYNDHSFSGSAGQVRSRKIEEGSQNVSVDIKDMENKK